MITIEEAELTRLEALGAPLIARHEEYMRFLRLHGNIANHLDIRWTHHGLLCGIAASPVYGMCGYVKLPKCLFDEHLKYDTVSALGIECHGGLTYGPDGGRWVGFDTSHAGDVWPWREVKPYITDPGQRRSHRITGYGGCGFGGGLARPFRGSWGPWKREWTAAALRGEVNHLADQIKRVAQGERLELD